MIKRLQIAAIVQRETGVPWFNIMGRRGITSVVRARDLCIALCRRLRCESYPEIAEWLGRDWHSGVETAHRRAEAKYGDDLERLTCELRAGDDSDERLVADVLSRPAATRLMIERLKPLMAAQQKRTAR